VFRDTLPQVLSPATHTPHELVVLEGTDLTFLPPASPALQPVERVWTLVDEPADDQDPDPLSLVVPSAPPIEDRLLTWSPYH
jgi:hypothetical protein